MYGFGSAFRRGAPANDIDLLIVHGSNDPASCRLAIACKRWFVKEVARADVTMLSSVEEAHFKFIATARATYLGAIREDYMDSDLAALMASDSRLRRKSLHANRDGMAHR